MVYFCYFEVLRSNNYFTTNSSISLIKTLVSVLLALYFFHNITLQKVFLLLCKVTFEVRFLSLV